MWENGLKELESMSYAVGKYPYFVQGGGGNTSVKLDEEHMAVKASGFKLKQITTKEGYVVINYIKIKDYYEDVDLSLDKDFEKESVEFAKSNVIEVDGLKTLRPSVEAGFHSILKKYVIHTHPVYANILCCSREGKSIADKIFKGRDFSFIWIPYINPGFCLTLKIKEEIEACLKNTGKFPEVVFMEKHGLIVNADEYERVLELNMEVNSLISKYLNINDGYPDIELEKLEGNKYRSRTEYILDIIKAKNPGSDFFEKTVLYPDQLVYLNGSISFGSSDNKLSINKETGELIYNTNYSEAQTIEETLLAYLYVIDKAEASGFSINNMNEKEIDFIKNWESEAYRKSLVSVLK